MGVADAIGRRPIIGPAPPASPDHDAMQRMGRLRQDRAMKCESERAAAVRSDPALAPTTLCAARTTPLIAPATFPGSGDSGVRDSGAGDIPSNPSLSRLKILLCVPRVSPSGRPRALPTAARPSAGAASAP